MADKKGYDLLNDSAKNKSTAFSQEERQANGLRGLLPYNESSLEIQTSNRS